MKEASILVVQLSEALTELWPELAEDLGATVQIIESDTAYSVDRETAAVLIAAGQREHDALEWLEAHVFQKEIPFIVVGADTSHRTAARLVRSGANDYFALPDDLEIMRNALASAVERRRTILRRETIRAAEAKDEAFAEIIGESPALKAALARTARVLPHGDATVLITGETGTGKELLARAIHEGGPRRGLPFVPVNCTALPGNLLESELFGHEKGAFTDAHVAKPGLFEIAKGGTLFLDEVGHLAMELQAKLLRVLEDRKVRRVGGTSWRTADVRIIAATNEDLERAVTEGTFRPDLYFRLGVITLSLPPLRERGDDTIVLAEAMIERLAKSHGLPQPKLSDTVRRALVTYNWPGNVRELRNSVERALLLSPPGELLVEELLQSAPAIQNGASGPIPFPATLDDITSSAARSTLELCRGNRSEAARRLGISRARLSRLLDRSESAN